jgi:putative flippase GtrA
VPHPKRKAAAEWRALQGARIRNCLFGDGLWAEAIRFGLVGLKSNVLYYFLYVALAAAGTGPKVAVTIVYLFGLAYTFWFNKGFVFRNSHLPGLQFARYVVVYLVAWALNLVLLDIAITRLGLNQYIAQALLTFPIAGMNFVLLKLFVFRVPRT